MVQQVRWTLKVKKIAKYLVLWGAALAVTSIAVAKLTGSLAPDAIQERLKPMGQVYIQGAPAQGLAEAAGGGANAAKTPQQIYDNNCKMCHQTGLAGAPKFGNKADWDPRIAQGLDTLVKAAITGIRAMPPKGNCLNCTEDEIKATVEFMVHAAQ